MSQDETEARKKRAERGWLADPPPPAAPVATTARPHRQVAPDVRSDAT